MGEELARGEINLDEPSIAFRPAADDRPNIPEPPPVRLVAVEDMHFPAAAGVETELDAFYVGLLHFVREAESTIPIYRAENFRLHFEIVEPPLDREDFRPLRVEVPSLKELESRFFDAEVEYTRVRGITPGQEVLTLLDPAGNWVEIGHWTELR